MHTRNGSSKVFSAVKRTLSSTRACGDRRPNSFFFGVFLLLWVTFIIFGCTAKLSESYYLTTHDPDNGFTNYFRVTTDGCAVFSSAKYSVGFYDRNAVERLFGRRGAHGDRSRETKAMA